MNKFILIHVKHVLGPLFWLIHDFSLYIFNFENLVAQFSYQEIWGLCCVKLNDELVCQRRKWQVRIRFYYFIFYVIKMLFKNKQNLRPYIK